MDDSSKVVSLDCDSYQAVTLGADGNGGPYPGVSSDSGRRAVSQRPFLQGWEDVGRVCTCTTRPEKPRRGHGDRKMWKSHVCVGKCYTLETNM